MSRGKKSQSRAAVILTTGKTQGDGMILYYDRDGTIYQIISDTGQYVLSGGATTVGGSLTIDLLPQNQSLVYDITNTAGQRDQNGVTKYWVKAGVLTLRQGWTMLFGFPPVSNPDYQTTDTPVHYYRIRTLTDLLTSLRTLTAQQKTNVWNDLSSGTPPKYANYVGGNDAGIFVLDWVISDSGLAGNALTGARLRITAMYVQDNTGYLVNPTFDASINVPGIIQV